MQIYYLDGGGLQIWMRCLPQQVLCYCCMFRVWRSRITIGAYISKKIPLYIAHFRILSPESLQVLNDVSVQTLPLALLPLFMQWTFAPSDVIPIVLLVFLKI